MAKRTYRQFKEVEEEYFRNPPRTTNRPLPWRDFRCLCGGSRFAIPAGIATGYAKVKGISNIAQETGLTQQGIQHALSSKGNPRFDNVNSIMNALGYRLVPEKLDNGQHI